MHGVTCINRTYVNLLYQIVMTLEAKVNRVPVDVPACQKLWLRQQQIFDCFGAKKLSARRPSVAGAFARWMI